MGTRVVWRNCRRCHRYWARRPTKFIQLHRARHNDNAHFRQGNFSGIVATSYLKIYSILCACVFFFVFSSTFGAANEVKTKLPKIILNLYGIQFEFSVSPVCTVTKKKQMCRRITSSPRFCRACVCVSVCLCVQTRWRCWEDLLKVVS